MPHATFLPPDLGSLCRLDELGLQVMGQPLEPGRAVLPCRVVETDEFARWCRRCGCEAAPIDSVTRRLDPMIPSPSKSDAGRLDELPVAAPLWCGDQACSGSAKWAKECA